MLARAIHRQRSGPARPAMALAAARILPLTLRVCVLLFPIVFMIGAAATHEVFGSPTTIGTDSSNYYAAAQRLNDGHRLYALGPGDRLVPLAPPYWSVPLLAPPPIAVLWRIPALLGDVSMYLWWIGSIAAVIATVTYAARTANPAAHIVVILLSPALGLTAVSGNANAFLLPALVGAWLLRDRLPLAAGALVAIAAAVKLSPALLLLWFLVRPGVAGRRNILGFFATGAVIGLASLAGAGVGAHFEYLDAMRTAGNGAATPLSLPGVLTTAGAPSWLATMSLPMLVAVGAAAAFLVRRDERISFTILAVVAALATPVVYFQTIALAAAGIAPWLRPLAPRVILTRPAVGTRDGRST